MLEVFCYYTGSILYILALQAIQAMLSVSLLEILAKIVALGLVFVVMAALDISERS